MNSATISARSTSALGASGAIEPRGYALHSDLAQFCLPAASRDTNRKLAYVNSICLLFLAIGLAGLNPPRLQQKVPEPIQVFVPIEIAQPPEPPKTEPQPQEQEPDRQPDTPVEMPQVATVVASAPPTATRAVVKMPAAAGGTHPEPSYPRAALEQREQGTVTVVMTVAPDGSV